METNNIFIHNDAMEISVISACIFDPNIYFYVRDLLSKELFTVYECVKAYEAIKQLDDEGKTPNMIEMDMMLKKSNIRLTFFVSDDIQTLEVTKQHVLLLQDMSIRRRLNALFYKGINMVNDPMIQLEDIQRLSKEFDAIICNNVGENLSTLERF